MYRFIHRVKGNYETPHIQSVHFDHIVLNNEGGIYFSSLMVSLLLMTQSLFTTAVTVILDLLSTVQAWRLHYWIKAEQDTTWYHAAYFLRHWGAHLGLNWPGYNDSNGDRSCTWHRVDSHTVNFIGDRSVDCVLRELHWPDKEVTLYWVLLYTYMITTWSTTVCCKHVSHFNYVIWQLPWSVCACRQRGRALTSKVHNHLKSPIYASHGGVQQWVVSMNAFAVNGLKKGTDYIVKRNRFFQV